MKYIRSDNAPSAVGPYSQAVQAGNTLYLSGQIGIDPSQGKITAQDVEGQAEQCCRNIAAVLAAAGADMNNVVKTTCFLRDIADFRAFNAVYAKHFVSNPARSCVAVRDLPLGALCEIEVVAALDS